MRFRPRFGFPARLFRPCRGIRVSLVRCRYGRRANCALPSIGWTMAKTPRAGESLTTNYGWTKPTVGASDDAWGGMVNANFDGIDSVVYGIDVRASTPGPPGPQGLPGTDGAVGPAGPRMNDNSASHQRQFHRQPAGLRHQYGAGCGGIWPRSLEGGRGWLHVHVHSDGSRHHDHRHRRHADADHRGGDD